MKRLTILFAALMAADALTTTIGLGMGGVEADPVVGRILVFGIIGVWILKCLQVLAIVGLVAYARKPRYLVPLSAFMALVVLVNVAQIATAS